MASALVLATILIGLIPSTSAYDFYVGGRDGWVQNPKESYNNWSSRMRFQVNDKLVFKYNKDQDSVLVVKKGDYDSCNTNSPIQKLDGGYSTFQFTQSGPFYFISGVADHCTKGQKLVVVVMAPRNKKPLPPPPPMISPLPTPAKSPSPSSLSPSPTSMAPAVSPSASPSASPAKAPTVSPSASPSASPAKSPTSSPSSAPSEAPTSSPTASSSPAEATGPSPSSSEVSPPEGPGSGNGQAAASPASSSSSSSSPPNKSSAAASALTLSNVTIGLVALVLSRAILG